MVSPALPAKPIAIGREAEVYAWPEHRVLRLLLPGHGSLAQLEREREVMRACVAAGVRAPDAGEIIEVDGRFGLVLERVDGGDLFDTISRQPWKVYAVGAQTGRLHAQVNAMEAPGGLPAVRDAMAANIERGTELPPGIRRRALDILAQLPDGKSLIHGDFHPGNILAGSGGPVIIDWTGFAGDPLADFTRTLIMLKAAAPPPGAGVVINLLEKPGRRFLLAGYERAYRRANPPIDRRDEARWCAVNIAVRIPDDVPGERANLLRLWDRVARLA